MNERAISGMSMGAVLATIGAILYFAVTAEIEGFDVNVAGAILMVVGFTVALVGLLWGVTESMASRPAARRPHRVDPPPARPVVTQQSQPTAPQRVVVETREVETHHRE